MFRDVSDLRGDNTYKATTNKRGGQCKLTFSPTGSRLSILLAQQLSHQPKYLLKYLHRIKFSWRFLYSFQIPPHGCQSSIYKAHCVHLCKLHSTHAQRSDPAPMHRIFDRQFAAAKTLALVLTRQQLHKRGGQGIGTALSATLTLALRGYIAGEQGHVSPNKVWEDKRAVHIPPYTFLRAPTPTPLLR